MSAATRRAAVRGRVPPAATAAFVVYLVWIALAFVSTALEK